VYVPALIGNQALLPSPTPAAAGPAKANVRGPASVSPSQVDDGGNARTMPCLSPLAPAEQKTSACRELHLPVPLHQRGMATCSLKLREAIKIL